MSKNDFFIHPTATVHPKAHLDQGVFIGPYSYIGENVHILKNTQVGSYIYIDGYVEIGEDNRFTSQGCIGGEPQDVSYSGEKTLVKIGDRNIFREFVTIHRGTSKGRGKTVIGNDNYFMAYSHVAHDCIVGNKTIFTHAATLGGHVTVGDFVNISGWSAVHQYCRLGKYSFIGGYSVITQDVIPYSRVAGGRPTRFYGLNSVGLRRNGFSKERIGNLKKMFNVLFHSGLNTKQAVEKLQKEFSPDEDRDEIIQFIQSSRRGIVKKESEEWKTESE